MKQKTKYFVDKIAPIFMAAIKQELIFPFIWYKQSDNIQL